LDADFSNDQWTLSGDIIYLVSTRSGGASHLIALHAGDGKQLWSTLLPPPTVTDDVLVPPLVADGMVYVPVNDRLFALHANNGNLAWQTDLNDLEIYGSRGSQPFAVGGGLLFLGTKDGIFRALHAQDGTLAWSVTVGEDIGLPTLVNGNIYLQPQNGHRIVALRAKDGAVLWHFQIPSSTDQQVWSLFVGPGHVYLIAYDTSPHFTIYALNAQDGKLLWQHEVPSAQVQVPPVQSLSVGSGRVYLGGANDGAGTIDTFNAQNGKLLWQHEAPQPYEESHEVNGIVYYLQSNVLLALRANDGKLLWQYEEPQTNDTKAAIYFIGWTHNVIFIRTEVNTYLNDLGAFLPCLLNCPLKGIIALNASNGSIYWQSECEIYAASMLGTTWSSEL
jgi:outer membrane protein assembly factor BamB